MTETISTINSRIADRVRDLRAAHNFSLDALATRSGVSRSMISLVERGETSPTAVVLEKLSTALGVALASLFDAPAETDTPTEPIARFHDQPLWQDPASGYTRRNVSPAHVPQAMQIVEVHFPSRARVSFETGARDVRVQQQVWMLEGSMDITVGATRHRLRVGDCLAMELDQPVMFHNPTRSAARYAVVLAPDHGTRR